MTFIEAMVALVIAAGVIIAALDASHLISARSDASAMEIESLLRAESLLAVVGADVRLAAGTTEGEDGPDVRWATLVEQKDYGQGRAHAFAITSQVTITRAGRRIQRSLSTLKLQQANQ
jgi:type II secretory pathway component PulJ